MFRLAAAADRADAWQLPGGDVSDDLLPEQRGETQKETPHPLIKGQARRAEHYATKLY